MKPCPKCGLRFRNIGLNIHLAKVHGIKVQHEGVVFESNELASESKLCPVPGCGLLVGNLLDHARSYHNDWLMSNGRFVFEVA